MSSDSRRLRPGQARPPVKRDPHARYSPEYEDYMMSVHAKIDEEANQRLLEGSRRGLKC